MPKKRRKKLTVRQRLWLAAYLDNSNTTTFLNAKESAIAAGYAAKSDAAFREIGYQTKLSLEPQITEWLEQEGLTDQRLKLKLVELLDATETKFFAHEGEVCDEREVKAWGVQTKALNMALKVKGLYSPEEHKHEVTGLSAIITEIQKSEGDCLSD